MTEQRSNRVRQLLESKYKPEYQKLDIEPKEGGKSLLHDEFGLPKVSPSSFKKTEFVNNITNEPVFVKNSNPNNPTQATAIPKKGFPSVSSQQNFEDDGFIPPKNNFVSVGNVESSWATKEVTGLPDIDNSNTTMVDNNWLESKSEQDSDFIAEQVNSLQGMNPLAELENPKMSEHLKQFDQKLQIIFSDIVEKLKTIDSIDVFTNFKSNVLGKNGVLDSILRKFSQIPAADRPRFGERINDIIDQLKTEFSAKEYELSENKTENPEDSSENTEDDETTKSAPINIGTDLSLQEGQFAILINNELFETADSIKEANDSLSKLILGNDVPVENVQLIKRIPISFGIILDD